MINYNKGTKALMKNNFSKALSFFKRVENPTRECYLNMGNAYRRLGDDALATKYYLLANSSLGFDGGSGAYPLALTNLGLIAYANGMNDTSINLYRAALSIDPLSYSAIWNMSSSYLQQYCSGGALHKDAWAMHEYRDKAVKPIPTFGLPRWNGEAGPVLVVGEQGFGDKIMMGRYISLIPECTLFIDPKTATLFPNVNCVDTVDPLLYKYYIPMGSLAGHFGVIETDYLSWVEPHDFGPGVHVGVEWAGSTSHLNDVNRSCFSSYFSTLAVKFPNVKFYNVRPGAPAVAGVTRLNSTSWVESASYVAGFDLVISVDTSIVHLAGTLGVKTLLMQPRKECDYRWGIDSLKLANGMDVEANLWYPSVCVMDNYGWDDMFSRVATKLEKYAKN